jgi:hypothetical protein
LSYIVILTTLSTFGIVKEASTSLYESYYNVFYGGCSALSVFESIQSRKDVIAKELLTNLGLYGTLSLPTILTGLEVVPHSLWLFVGWGAYRKLNASSRFRSCLAFALCILFLAPIWSLLALAGLQVFRAFAPEVSC